MPTNNDASIRLAAKDKRIADLTAELRNATASIWDRMAELGKAHDTIKSLTRERDEARAACAEYCETLRNVKIHSDDSDAVRWAATVLNAVNPGQPLLDELDRLRRLEAALDDDSLMRVFYKDSGHADVTMLILRSYRDALLVAVGKD